MIRHCTDICKYKFDAIDLQQGTNTGEFINEGFKLCKRCHVVIKYDGNYCPCCSCKLSITPIGRYNFSKPATPKRY